MKARIFSALLSLILATALFAGCGTSKASANLPAENDYLTKEQAQAAALTHAGLTAAQITRLHTEFDIDNGIPQYDIEFHYNNWEYDYEIHAQTGAILSWDKEVE